MVATPFTAPPKGHSATNADNTIDVDYVTKTHSVEAYLDDTGWRTLDADDHDAPGVFEEAHERTVLAFLYAYQPLVAIDFADRTLSGSVDDLYDSLADARGVDR